MSILKTRDITLPTKVHIVKAMVFPVGMNGCESWIIQKAEHWRTDAFKLWCWRRLLRVPWTQSISNQWILREINPEYSIRRTDAEAEAPVLWLPDAKSYLNGKDPDTGRLKAGGEGDNRGWDGWMASLTRWTWTWANSGRWWGLEEPVCAAIHGFAKSQIWLSNPAVKSSRPHSSRKLYTQVQDCLVSNRGCLVSSQNKHGRENSWYLSQTCSSTSLPISVKDITLHPFLLEPKIWL